MRPALLLSILVACGCGKRSHVDIAGPFTGVTYRFVVDTLQLPMERSDFADDLNGDLRLDDQLGTIVGTLAGQRDLTDATDDLLGSGVLAPVVEITTDDPALRNDPTVGVRFRGADGEPADEMGAALVDGVLTSNPTRLSRTPASATIHLPLFTHADPLALPARGLEVTLTADGGGFSGVVRGGFVTPADLEPAWRGVTQMIAANPQQFPTLLGWLDHDRDGVIRFDEFTHTGVIENLIAPDVELTDGNGRWAPTPANTRKDSLSFGFAIHLVPCAAGSCHAPPADRCRDRVLDGDETDIDCGGACLPCPGGARCTAGADCQSRQCAGGTCAPPSCSDGVQDGGETGVDCGYGCGACPNSSGCRDDADCATGYCADNFLAIGTCRALLCSDGVRDNDETDVDCGGHCPACTHGQSCGGPSDCASQSCIGAVCN